MKALVKAKNGEGNARCLYAKVAGKGAFYCFGGLNHLAYKSKGRVDPGSFAQQVDEMREAGFDGIKLIEGKPSVRRDWYPFPLDGDYYRDFFARAEKVGMPIIWHVADPANFWTDGEGRSKGWTYASKDVSKEKLHQEVENVAKRHPKLTIILAHFSFLSGEL